MSDDVISDTTDVLITPQLSPLLTQKVNFRFYWSTPKTLHIYVTSLMYSIDYSSSKCSIAAALVIYCHFIPRVIAVLAALEKYRLHPTTVETLQRTSVTWSKRTVLTLHRL